MSNLSTVGKLKPKRQDFPSGVAGRQQYNEVYRKWLRLWVAQAPRDKQGIPIKPNRKDFQSSREWAGATAAYNWARSRLFDK